ncbi:sensor histidine kinase [Paenibacillus sp. GCM10023252]|uniref:sensor histidine kinase n=1 Tax=Paenibacillus sp. GCM10023252 TaxID=3252649 RepID=UPI00360EC8A7
MKSLKWRMVWSYLLLIVLVVGVLGGVFVTLIYNYYYGSAESSVKQRAVSALSQHSRTLSSLQVRDQADYMLQYMVEGGTRLQLLDPDGHIRMDTDGFGDHVQLTTPDVRQAEAGNTGTWRGEDPYYGVAVTSVTIPIWNDYRVVSLLRYSASTEQVDGMVRLFIQLTAAVGLAVILLFLGVSLVLAQRIVKPIRELTRAARYMAEGDWSRRASQRSKDEIGQLAETFNRMVTELNKREQLKNDFISSISHELRTPLTSIKGWSETLKEGDPADEEELHMGLSIINRETDRLSGLVEDLLDFSKLASNNMVLHVEELDLNGPVSETVNQLAVREETTGVKLTAALGQSPIVVAGDANRLKQVLINLIDNAFKFTGEGGTIRVSTMEQGDEAVLVIADSGIGIAEEDLPHVTERFYKASGGSSGSGLGLAICKEIIQLHSGKLTVESERGAGTAVTIRLPLRREIE